MSNPFSKPALDLIIKRDRWEKLTYAREWVAENYAQSEFRVQVACNQSSSVNGYSDMRSVLEEMLLKAMPDRESILFRIDAELAALEA